MPPPAEPKIYHVVHKDRLASIIADGCLWSDAIIVRRQGAGTTIGMGHIKERRLRLPVPATTAHAWGYWLDLPLVAGFESVSGRF